MKKEGGRAPDYVQERMGHTRRSFSNDFSHGMTLNSNSLSNVEVLGSRHENKLHVDDWSASILGIPSDWIFL